MMPIEFRPATIEGVAFFVAIAGTSRSGKTFSALRMARGIAGPNGRIAAIDTERRRMSHYKADFRFDVYNMEAPFRPHRFTEAAMRAQLAGYDVLIIDNFSLEWTGDGGVLDWQEEELQRLVPSGDEKERNKKGQTAWIKPKRAHKTMMTAFLQLSIPVIFCLRAEDKTKPNAAGIPEKIGWVPTMDSRFIYEWTVALTLHPDTPGAVRLDLPHKIAKPHRELFPDGCLIDEVAGAALYQWANSDKPEAAAPGLPGEQSRPPVPPPSPTAAPSGRPATAAGQPAPDVGLPDAGPGQTVADHGQTGRATSPPAAVAGQTAEHVRQTKATNGQTVAQRKAADFVDELVGSVRASSSPHDMRALLNQLAVKRRLSRLQEDHLDEHDRAMAAVALRTQEFNRSAQVGP